jgi:hypothetical protein
MKKLVLGLGLALAVIAPTAFVAAGASAHDEGNGAHEGLPHKDPPKAAPAPPVKADTTKFSAPHLLSIGRTMGRESRGVMMNAVRAENASRADYVAGRALHAQAHDVMIEALRAMNDGKDRTAIAQCHASGVYHSMAIHERAWAAQHRGLIERLVAEAKEDRRVAGEMKLLHPQLAGDLEVAAVEADNSAAELKKIDDARIKNVLESAKKHEQNSRAERDAANKQVPGFCD